MKQIVLEVVVIKESNSKGVSTGNIISQNAAYMCSTTIPGKARSNEYIQINRKDQKNVELHLSNCSFYINVT